MHTLSKRSLLTIHHSMLLLWLSGLLKTGELWLFGAEEWC